MNFIARTLFRLPVENLLARENAVKPLLAQIPRCCLHVTSKRYQVENQEMTEAEAETESTDEENKILLRPVIDVETSIRYMNSKAYQITYMGASVWEPYRRNHKGAIPPEKTRKTCIRAGVISTGNPCPICRDEYLVLHPSNTQLLAQFISPQTGDVLSYQKTGVCQKQHKNLLVAVQQAWDKGTIKMPVPFRQYDYSEYYPDWKQAAK